MDMRNLKFEPNSFDGIWVSASFLHVPKADSKKCLQGFYRILRPKGLLYLGVVAGDGEKVLYEEEYDGIGKFYAYYTKEELCPIIESSRFEVIKMSIEKQQEHKWLNVFATKR
jgi:ubiquinone/menaquinone biosynthesis C-methylase UbiE